MDRFFSLNNPVMKFLTHIVDLAIVNVLTVVHALGIVTAGGALTAMNYVLFHLQRRDETYVAKMFRKSFKDNFRHVFCIFGRSCASIAAVFRTARLSPAPERSILHSLRQLPSNRAVGSRGKGGTVKMTELLWFVGGLLFGGFVSTMFLCCLQLHRINKYEALIRELTMKLESQKA